MRKRTQILPLVTMLIGEELARIQQLAMQYDPPPPCDACFPARAGLELTNQVTVWMMWRKQVAASANRASKSTNL